MIMIPSITYLNYNKPSNRVSFGTNCRKYLTPDNKKMETFTCLFRDDIDWISFANYLDDNFKRKNKVNIINPACSDGSESYTLIMSLKECLSDSSVKKFLPIKAYDIDKEILNAANSGLLMIADSDFYYMNESIEDITPYLRPELEKTLEIDLDQKKIPTKLWGVKDSIRENVTFEEGDMFKLLDDLEDDSNTVFICRNVLGHLTNSEAKIFAMLASSKLKEGSLVLIGDYDKKCTRIATYMRENGFKEVLNNVYKRVTSKVEELPFKIINGKVFY